MARYSVLLSDTPVGILMREADGTVSFYLTKEYKELVRRPVIGQFFEDDLDAVHRETRGELPPFFSNLVPEGPLRRLIEKALALPPGDDLLFLSAVSDDLPGAVRIVAVDQEVDKSYLTAENEQDRLSQAEARSDTALRFSLAGVQMKFSLFKEDERLTMPGGSTFGDWIVKLDSSNFPRLAENEYATMKWAQAAGFRVPECQILSADALPDAVSHLAPPNSKIFLIKRYDRADAVRIHQEDIAQVLNIHPRFKYSFRSYESLGYLIREICGLDTYRDFIKRLVFMVASGNGDAHLKNWSLYYPDGINAELAPLYDQVMTLAYRPQVSFEWALPFAGVKDPYATDMDVFMTLIKTNKGRELELQEIVVETIRQIAAAWQRSGIADLLPSEHVHALQEYWMQSPFLSSFAKLA